MLDNALFALLIATIKGQLATANLPANLPIVQAFQPTQQGVNTQATAYLYKIGDHRLGTPYRTDAWDVVNGVMMHTELQDYETTFQISALVTQDPLTPTQLTASDVLNQIAYILQSSKTIAALAAQSVGMLRVEEVRNPYFTDDRGRNEASPSFDFVVQHKQIVMSQSDPISDVTFDLVPV